MTSPLTETTATIVGLRRALDAGSMSCVQALEACLARIDRDEPQVHAWVLVDREGARRQAEQRDRERAEGRPLGPLHGVPVAIKDIIDVAGLPTAAGARLWAERIASADAPVVARLRAAGAVIVGKTVTTPYAWIDPPPTRNPWNRERTPGGSSSGSAAALACGMCLGALGSQTGGSITRPAAYCGVAGLKPTYGRLDASGIVPLAPSLDHPGPLARTAADLALLWQALCPEDEPVVLPDLSPRIGPLGGLFHDRAAPETLAALDAALARLASAGATITHPELPPAFGTAGLQHRAIMAAEAASVHTARRHRVPDDYPPRISALIDEGSEVRAIAYLAAVEHQRLLKQSILALFAGADVLATPSATGPAPEASTTGDPVFNSPWSYTGLPTVTIPMGRSPDGLPLGLQLIGRPRSETALLGIARWCEPHLPPWTHADGVRA